MAETLDKSPDVFCEFNSELLSPSELFTARSRSHKIPVRGQKDFLPDGSERQRERLQQSLEEHWDLLSEERVERLGNLVRAEWIPSERVVELTSPGGKFWQTMGFSEHGKQLLFPEEALYLMECGNVQVFFRGLPLSIQEGYGKFISPDTVSLQEYQVFGHLKRLGYVVNRFIPSCVPSLYERQLNLTHSPVRSGRHLKHKRSHSSTSSLTDGQEEITERTNKRQNSKAKDPGPDPYLELASSSKQEEDKSTEMQGITESVPGRCWWLETKTHPRCQTQTSGACWDFSVILFPDLGSQGLSPSSLPTPDPSLLPGEPSVGSCNIAPWLWRLNLRKDRSSWRERERERKRNRYKWGVNEDREVRRCSNWAEYRELLERRSRQRHRSRPPHLWEGRVRPLHQPGEGTSTGELLNRISVIKHSHLLDEASRLGKGLEEWRISFNVFQPDSVAEFKKSNPGKPYSRMCVCSFEGPVPDLRALKHLAFQSGDVPVTFAVVDHGDISFYSFKDFQLPTDVSH